MIKKNSSKPREPHKGPIQMTQVTIKDKYRYHTVRKIHSRWLEKTWFEQITMRKLLYGTQKKKKSQAYGIRDGGGGDIVEGAD